AAILWLWPSAITSILDAFGVAELGFTNALRAAAFSHPAFSIAVPIATMALGVYLFRSAKAAHKMTLAIAAGMGLLSIAANVIIEPAIANTLSLESFTADVLKVVDDHPLGYLLDMDYGV